MGESCAAGAAAAGTAGARSGGALFVACPGTTAATGGACTGKRGARPAIDSVAVSVPPLLASAGSSCGRDHTRTPISSSIARCRASNRSGDGASALPCALIPAPSAMPGSGHLVVAIPALYSWADCRKQIALPARTSLRSHAQKKPPSRDCAIMTPALQRRDYACGCNLVAYLPSYIAGHTATHPRQASGIHKTISCVPPARVLLLAAPDGGCVFALWSAAHAAGCGTPAHARLPHPFAQLHPEGFDPP